MIKPYFDELSIPFRDKPAPFKSRFDDQVQAIPDIGRLGRRITSRIAKDLAAKEKQFLPFPLQMAFMSSVRKAAIKQEKWDMVLFGGGQIAPVPKYATAKELMRAIVEETTTCFNNIAAD